MREILSLTVDIQGITYLILCVDLPSPLFSGCNSIKGGQVSLISILPQWFGEETQNLLQHTGADHSRFFTAVVESLRCSPPFKLPSKTEERDFFTREEQSRTATRTLSIAPPPDNSMYAVSCYLLLLLHPFLLFSSPVIFISLLDREVIKYYRETFICYGCTLYIVC